MRRSMRTAALAGVLGALSTGSAAAQTPDVAGTWILTVTTDQGVTRPSVTLVQDGEALRGDYSSDTLGEHEVSGSVTASEVTWSLTAGTAGRSFPVVYRGTLAEDGTISGTIDIAAGLMTGSFTAVRSGGRSPRLPRLR